MELGMQVCSPAACGTGTGRVAWIFHKILLCVEQMSFNAKDVAALWETTETASLELKSMYVASLRWLMEPVRRID